MTDSAQSVTILAVYPETNGFSGMTEATRHIIKVHEGSGSYLFVKCASVSRASEQSTLRYFWSLSSSFLRNQITLFSHYFSKRTIYYLNLSQTFFGFFRDGLPVFLATLLKKDKKLVISLHGNLFMKWSPTSLKMRLFVYQLKRASMVTVLGPKQLDFLAKRGISRKKIRIVNNASFFEIPPEELHTKLTGEKTPFTVLHLSNLIESKGYPVFLEALHELAKEDKLEINGILCGMFLGKPSDHSCRSTKWIEEKIGAINQSKNVRAHWIQGAYGQEKQRLFKSAHTFVFPSIYPVEAQPIVLLEAMSAGCSIITTTAGEIEYCVQNCGIILQEPSASAIAEQIRNLVNSPSLHREYATKAYTLYKERYSPNAYKLAWAAIFDSLLSAP